MEKEKRKGESVMTQKQSPQSIATRKYEAKVGLISKSYKIKRELADQFAEACRVAGVSQASQISKMMREFIDTQKE